jgi:Rapamycin-insensitive companion of mTOR, domain 5
MFSLILCTSLLLSVSLSISLSLSLSLSLHPSHSLYLHLTPLSPSFRCVTNVLNSPNYTMRATFFYVLGLIGRNQKGVRQLAR